MDKNGGRLFANEVREGAGNRHVFGDLTGIFQTAGIPIRETLYDGNNPAWLAAVTRPDFFLHEEWAVAQAGRGRITGTVVDANGAGLAGVTVTLLQQQREQRSTITGDGGTVADSAGTMTYTRTGKKTGRIDFIDAVGGAGVMLLTFTGTHSMAYTMTLAGGNQKGTMAGV